MIKVTSLLSFSVYLSIGFIALLGSTSANAGEDYVISAAEMTGYGVFQSNFNQRHRESTSNSPPLDLVTSVRFESITRQIPMQVGINFGFEYLINTTPIGAKIEVRSVIRFPEGELVSPSGKVYTESEETYKVIVGDTTLHGHGFDEAWEMVPGTWTFEIWHRGAKLIRKDFNVGPAITEAPTHDH